jgi:hypothetical protein
MRCMACGAEMILVNAIEDHSMPVAGFERRAYICSLCNETEQRLVFNKPSAQAESAIAPVSTSDVRASTPPTLIERAKNLVRLARAK